MSVWAVLPVKSLVEGKSRLEGELDLGERVELNFGFFMNTARALLEAPSIDGLCVVSKDTRVLREAETMGALTVEEVGTNLNSALDQARSVLAARGIHQILVLPADLPLVQPTCIEAVMLRRKAGLHVILVPDRHMQGTNLLYLDPAEDFDFCFGEASFQKHLSQAKEKGREVEIVRSQELSFDVDTPEDLEWLRKNWMAFPYHQKEK